MEIGLLITLLNSWQQPLPVARNTAIADWATGVASAKIKTQTPNRPHWGQKIQMPHIFYTLPFVEQEILRCLLPNTKQDPRA